MNSTHTKTNNGHLKQLGFCQGQLCPGKKLPGPFQWGPLSVGGGWESLRAAPQGCLTLCEPRDCSPPGSSVHGISQPRTLEWVAISSSRGASRPRDWTCISCTAGRLFISWGIRQAALLYDKHASKGNPYHSHHLFIGSKNLLGLLSHTFTPATQCSINLGIAILLWAETIIIGSPPPPRKEHFVSYSKGQPFHLFLYY